MKKVKLTKKDLSSTKNLIAWYKKHNLVTPNRIMYDAAFITTEDSKSLQKNIGPADWLNYVPCDYKGKETLDNGWAFVYNDKEIATYKKKLKLRGED